MTQWDVSMPLTQPASEPPCGKVVLILYFDFSALMDDLTTVVACFATSGGLVLGWDQLSTLFVYLRRTVVAFVCVVHRIYFDFLALATNFQVLCRC